VTAGFLFGRVWTNFIHGSSNVGLRSVGRCRAFLIHLENIRSSITLLAPIGAFLSSALRLTKGRIVDDRVLSQ
jgi:hypothetical protein